MLILGFLVFICVYETYSVQLDTSKLSETIRDITDNSLDVPSIQEHFYNLEYSRPHRDPSETAASLTKSIISTFDTQKKSLERLKNQVEALYKNSNFADRSIVVQCCDVVGLSQSYQFVVNVSEDKSCDRFSQTSDESAESLYGKLNGVYKENNRVPMKWQYFGSEEGILNQFPASRAEDCTSYDHRFRPWYIASATPNPKDVILAIKNNLFSQESVQAKLFEAADIILRTLNPKDRLTVILYNSQIIKYRSVSCYESQLSVATQSNIEKFRYFLQTRPDPQSGHNLNGVLGTAFNYFENDRLWNTSRDRAIVLITDGERIESKSEKIAIQNLITQRSQEKTSIFVFAAVKGSIQDYVRTFYKSNVITASLPHGSNPDSYYIELPASGDLRGVMTSFYQTFASPSSDNSFENMPVFLTPYYDVFGLAQLVLTLATPCYGQTQTLLGVAAVDLTLEDLLANIEYFNEGDLSYAFIIDKEGKALFDDIVAISLTLFHPRLPVPTNNYTFIHLDISTLEPQPGFASIRQSMINRESGCQLLNSTQVLSRGNTLHGGATTFVMLSNYCWRPVNGTPFSLCVVIPVNTAQFWLNHSGFSIPTNDIYHRIDVPSIGSSLDLCQHIGHKATIQTSTVKLSPESYSQPGKYLLENESESDAIYLQRVVRQLHDSQHLLRSGIVGSIAATFLANKLWIANKTGHESSIIWRYIATVDGLLRIYPGTQVYLKEFDPLQRPWYQRAVAYPGKISISAPYLDVLTSIPVVTLSQAILSHNCINVTHSYGTNPGCSVLGVMGVDLTMPYIWQILTASITLCGDSQNYRCMIIDSTGYIVSHPSLFSNPSFSDYIHLTQLEPFISQDMLALGYLKQVHCNNFQYNFTTPPRRQISYEISEKISLDGGHSKFCVFYKATPVSFTNTFVIAVDLKRSATSMCPNITCPCDPDMSCSSLPEDCVCPCTEDITDENYNACDESFSDLSGPSCPVRFGYKAVNFNTVQKQLNSSLPQCFQPNCSASTRINCESRAGCYFCPMRNLSSGSIFYNCTYSSNCTYKKATDLPPYITPSAEPKMSSFSSWKVTALIFIIAFILTLLLLAILICVCICKAQRHRKVTLSCESPLQNDAICLNTLKNSNQITQPRPKGVEVLDFPTYETQESCEFNRNESPNQTEPSTSTDSMSHTPPQVAGNYGNSGEHIVISKASVVCNNKRNVNGSNAHSQESVGGINLTRNSNTERPLSPINEGQLSLTNVGGASLKRNSEYMDNPVIVGKTSSRERTADDSQRLHSVNVGGVNVDQSKTTTNMNGDNTSTCSSNNHPDSLIGNGPVVGIHSDSLLPQSGGGSVVKSNCLDLLLLQASNTTVVGNCPNPQLPQEGSGPAVSNHPDPLLGGGPLVGNRPDPQLPQAGLVVGSVDVSIAGGIWF